MIYLQNTKIIKDIEILQDLPALNTPVLSDIETGATITLGTQLSVSNMPTGATLYVNGSSVQGSTFTITPDASASTRNYLYTINLQFKGLSGFEDSEIASYTLKMKNPTPTVSLDSGVFTQSSKSITVTRQENVYEVEQDQRCIRGEYDSTSEGTWCNVLMLSDTSTYCQFNFFIRETDYADRSDVVTRYYHIAGSESMPTPTISYDENNENFTISINNWPTDPVNNSYMSSDYTIYYSINSETVNTQYNSIAISCSAGDVIRAKVVSGAGFADSEVASYSVTVPVVETPTLGDGFDGFYAMSNGDSFQYSPTNGTYIQYLGINGSYTYWTDASEELVEIYDSTLASAVESAELTPGQFVDPNGFTATKSIYQSKHQLNTVSGLSFDSQYVDIDDGNPYEDSIFESLTATTLALTNVDTSHYESYNEYYKLANVKIVDAAEDGITFVAYDVNQNACIVYDQMGVFTNETLNYDSTQYDIYGFISTYRGMSEFYPVLIQESETQNSAFAGQYNVTVLKGRDIVGQTGENDQLYLQTRQSSIVSSNNDSGLYTNAARYGNGAGINITNNRISKVVIVDSLYNSVTSQSRCMTISTDGNTTTTMTTGNAGACTFTASNINSSSQDVVQIANANNTAVNVLAAIIVESYRTYSLHPVWYDNITHEWYNAQLNHHDSNAGLFWYDEAPTSDCCIAVMVRDNTGAPYEPSQSAQFATTDGIATTWTYGWYFSNVQQRHPGVYYDDKYWGEGGIEVRNVNGSGADIIACGYRYGESKKYNPMIIFNDGNEFILTQTIGEQIYYRVFDYTLTHRLIYNSNKGTKPASITITSSNTSVFTVSNNGRYIESVGYGEAAIELTYTVGNDSYIHQSTAYCEEPQPIFSDTYAFSDGGDQIDDGNDIVLTEGDVISLTIVEINSGDEVSPDSASASSDDDSVATATWDDNEGCFSIEAIAAGNTMLSFSIEIDGTLYTPILSVSIYSAEPEPTSIPFNPASVTGNVPTSSVSSGEGTLSNGGAEIYCDYWYISGGQYRTQNGATLIRITGTTNFITQIEFDGVERYGCSNMSPSSGSLDDTDAPNGVWTGNGEDSSIEFALSNRVRFTEIRVYLGDEIPEPAPSFSDNYAFYSEEHEEVFEDGGEFHLFNGSSSIVKLFDLNNDTELTPDSTPTCSSDDDEGVTITWSDNDNAFTITALDADLEIPVSIEVTIDGVTYNAGFTVFTVAASE